MYNPKERKVNITPEHGRRYKTLGDIGEAIAIKLLQINGFTEILDLNLKKKNFLFADYLATREGTKYLISVKARNKYENNGKLNSRYKLGSNVYAHIQLLQKQSEYSDCVPAWLAIAIEDRTFDAYFGTIEQLNGSRGISMSPKKTMLYERLAKNFKHSYESSLFLNTY